MTLRWTRHALLWGLLLVPVLLSSCACQPASTALLGDPRERYFRSDVVTAKELHSAFDSIVTLKREGKLDGEYSEGAIVRLHTYLHIAGDAPFAAALSREPAKTRRLVSAYMIQQKLERDYPLTYKVLAAAGPSHWPGA